MMEEDWQIRSQWNFLVVEVGFLFLPCIDDDLSPNVQRAEMELLKALEMEEEGVEEEEDESEDEESERFDVGKLKGLLNQQASY